MDLGLKDRVVLVTGSSSGIGKAAAVAFGTEGARVVSRIMRTAKALKEPPRKYGVLAGKRWFCTTTWRIQVQSGIVLKRW